jgi:hypothetical protein
MNRTRSAVLCTVVLLATAAQARVISYSPYTDRASIPAVQSRLNRHFVLVEQTGTTVPVPIGSPIPPNFSFPPAQVVLYDSTGIEEPRVIFPQDGSAAPINNAIVREEPSEAPVVLIQTTADFNGGNPTRQPIWLLSNNGGNSWVKLSLPTTTLYFPNGADTGGTFARARFSNVLPGTREVPFVLVNRSDSRINAITFDGSIRILTASPMSTVTSALLGRDVEGRRFLVQNNFGVLIVDLNGTTVPASQRTFTGTAQGWITPDGGAYVEENSAPGKVVLWYLKDGSATPVAAAWDGPPETTPVINPSFVFFAIPTADYRGAWMIRRGGGRPTTLLLHTPSSGLAMQWQDVSAAEVEALHPAASGNKVLLQVHRQRQTIDQLLFKDPALAVWHVGDPMPKFYDELFLSETLAKGFVHLDVDKLENGDQFVFDSGIPTPPGGGGIIFSPPPASGGGSDVVQEWGVVRASLRQKLVLPGVGRTPGAFGSKWATDLTLYNPADSAITVGLMFLPNGIPLPVFDPPPGNPLLISLQGHEIRMIPDVVGTLFRIENSTGALYIIPAIGAGVNVTSRTYNTASNGTYGFTMNGIDVFTAAGPRFPLSFSGAFEGANFRTNLMLTDVSGRGSDVAATVASPNGSSATGAVTFAGPESGQTQINGLWQFVGLSPADTGALVLRPNKGETIASVFVVDNRTNDPTFFPPDIPASVMRVIPAIGHLDGANGSKFRSDLYLFNNSSQPKTLTLQAKLWDVPENPSTLQFTLLPFEARVIRDVLATAFGKTGIARLRFTSQGSFNDTSVRVTSRTYTIDPNGGTYGFLMPPLNSFQSGGPGDTLEILGGTLDPHFRTNLGLVDLTAFPGIRPARAKVEIISDGGSLLDSFEVSVPSAGGMQINDLFHGRGLPESERPVLIRVSTIEGMIGAYAAFVDNGTNDPAYVAANLAAKN